MNIKLPWPPEFLEILEGIIGVFTPDTDEVIKEGERLAERIDNAIWEKPPSSNGVIILTLAIALHAYLTPAVENCAKNHVPQATEKVQ